MNQRNTLRTVAKMSDRQVVDMTRRLNAGLTTVKEEAIRFGVGTETIRRARRGDTFPHLQVDNPERAIVGEVRALSPEPTENEMQAAMSRMFRVQEEQEKKRKSLDVGTILDEIQKGGTSGAVRSLGLLDE